MRTKVLTICVLLVTVLTISLLALNQTTKAQKPGPATPTSTPIPPLDLKRQLEQQSSSTSPLLAPTNDDFNAAALISVLPYQHAIDTTSATVAADDPAMGCGVGQNSNTVWYRYMPPASGSLEINTFGTTFDTVLAVFTGARGSLTRVTCNDDAGGTVQSQVILSVAANQTYFVEVADYGSPGGGQLIFRINPESAVVNQYMRTNFSLNGQFVMGTTGGDPITISDDDKRLLYGFPSSIGTSFTTARVVNGASTTDYQLGKSVTPISQPTWNGTNVTTIWSVAGVRIEQRIYFATNPTNGRPDTTAIEYQVTNNNSSSRQVGLRILLDTMVGDNDGAPLYAPGWGSITQERDSTNGGVPDYWIAWESPTFDPNYLKARGLLRGINATPPNRLVVAHWDATLCSSAGPGIYSTAWEYSVNPNASITCDSAVAMYYSPVNLTPGQSRTIRTYYGLIQTSPALTLAPDVLNLVNASRQNIQSIGTASIDVSTVGDYFLDKLTTDAIEWVVNLSFNATDLLTAGVSWAKIGRGLNNIAAPGYEAALHASWRGWVDDVVAKHWYKPLYDGLANNRKLLFKETAKAGMKYYAEEITDEAIKEWFKHVLTPGPGTPIYEHIGSQDADLASHYRIELLREQNDLLAGLAVLPLDSTQIALYRSDMQARQQVSTQLANLLVSHRDLLWHSYEKALADEHNWLKFWGPLLLKWGVIGGATLLWDGPGYYIASIGTAAVSTIYDLVQDTRALSHDQKMLDQSLRFLNGRVSSLYSQISLNTVNALNLIRAGDEPQIAGGNVNVEAMKSFGHYRLWPGLWWAESASQIDLSIHNNKSYSTTYEIFAAYNHSSFWSGTERFLPEGQAIELNSSASGTAIIPFKSPDWGLSPDNSSTVDVLVLGATNTGLYPVSSLSVNWDPIRIDQFTAASAKAPEHYTSSQASNAAALPYPLSSSVASVPDSNDYILVIDTINPFTFTVQATITQVIPSNLVVLDAGSGNFNGGSIIWTVSLEPNTGQSFQARLRWTAAPGQLVTIAGADLTFTDLSTGLGDTYNSPPQQVEAAWPLEAAPYIPAVWQIGESVTIPITLTNISTAVAAQGVLTVTVSTLNGLVLATSVYPVNIPNQATGSITLLMSVPRNMGYVAVSGEAMLGTIQRDLFEEVAYIQGIHTYLPTVMRNSDSP